MAGPALGGLLSFRSPGAPAFAAAGLAFANAVFGYLSLPESHPPGLRRHVPILRLNPASQLAGVLRVEHTRALLLAMPLLNLASLHT